MEGTIQNSGKIYITFIALTIFSMTNLIHANVSSVTTQVSPDSTDITSSDSPKVTTPETCFSSFQNSGTPCSPLMLLECTPQQLKTISPCLDNSIKTLVQAAKYNKFDLVQKFLATKPAANIINAKDNNDMSVIICAAMNNNFAMVKALIAAGADINIQDSNGFTALIYAAFNGNFAMVQALIAAKADVNIVAIHGDQDQDTVTALGYAFYHADLDMVQALLAAGANPNTTFSSESMQQDAANSAYYAPNGAALMAVLQNALNNPTTKTQPVITTLIQAAQHNNLNLVQKFLAAHPAPTVINAQDSAGKTALLYAISFENLEMVKALIAAGVDVNTKNNILITINSVTPLILAISFSNLDIVKELLAAGAIVNTAMQFAQNISSPHTSAIIAALQNALNNPTTTNYQFDMNRFNQFVNDIDNIAAESNTTASQTHFSQIYNSLKNRIEQKMYNASPAEKNKLESELKDIEHKYYNGINALKKPDLRTA